MGAGLPQSFDYRDQPGVKVKTDPKWRLEREKLNDLLTPKEVRSRYMVYSFHSFWEQLSGGALYALA